MKLSREINISLAVFTALRISSVFFSGAPYKTINSSPIILSNVPLYLNTTSIILSKKRFNNVTTLDASRRSDIEVNPLISENKTHTSCSIPPNSKDSSFKSNSSTIFSETYFLNVDFTLFMSDRSSIEITDPEFTPSSNTGEIVKLICVCF